MKQVAVIPPPLPPKTRRAPPGTSTTVLKSPDSNLDYGIQTPHSQFSISPATSDSHVVKILINPQDGQVRNKSESKTVISESGPCVRLSVNGNDSSDMIQKTENYSKNDQSKPFFLYGPYSYNGTMTSGQVSPSDTLDSGTCSDLDGTPPPLPRKKNSGVSITVINNQHKRVSSIASSGVDADSDDNDSNVSYDSLNSGDVQSEFTRKSPEPKTEEKSIFPQNLLQDIRDRTVKLTQVDIEHSSDEQEELTETRSVIVPPVITHEKLKGGNFENVSRGHIVDESTYEERKQKEIHQEMVRVFNDLAFDSDKLIKFHLNEHHSDDDTKSVQKSSARDDESFAGYRDYLGVDGAATIRSAKGTIRGVKNRVRAGIATFLQIGNTTRVSFSFLEK
ncbi:glutaredoxin domain-containing cysteine-rich protein CG31559-like [Agrilus planipennis]|uniref:Glutaredoxin domain-containing cysteine-rich protein CG31559-like n=1 Tax=Agrilus planipennis TaxID=224129 RepID=A0A1W4XDP8_AGRPL|nr:glutaredoxin domain-containing cysteine-rich protein CG31559-like [Agrilus planipennis]XP_018330558.1 glutaredoxin domain-containing cysteine-rich protein CG31559-like [Agrilus planipennis]XP_018330566.1 glutaredoxin domain-containing cysteine-rich protein CG31559-like [Agrilus planipennis]